MLENSSAETLEGVALRPATGGWTRQRKVALLLLNTLPICHVALVVTAVAMVPGPGFKAAALIAGIYLLPPIFVRLLSILHPLREGSFALDGADFLWWWASAQAQILFCRFPYLEEALRLVPGLYSAWLRLWGAKIGRLTYWAPELRILDRSLLIIGNNVIFGAGVRLNPHVIAEDERGEKRLHLGPVSIGDGSSIGGYSLLTAGTNVGPGQTLKAHSLSPPFTTWSAGRRAKLNVPR